MAWKLKKMGYSKIYCLKGGFREWVKSGFPVEEKWTIRKECVTCHSEVTPGIV
ncbi:MAG: hypothetical protein DRH11_04560 [Deltaproteobacteria bacterium]|nr:MAG: hypothetical protein DRH11_04560 [Deltaproteobacteria bacterium]